MKPLAVDFAPRPAARSPLQRLRWFAGGAGALLLVVSSAAWLLTPPAEAGHMGMAPARHLPGTDEAQAVDAAVRKLNAPWLAALDALASTAGDVALLYTETDPRRGVLRISGEARNDGTAQSLPGRLRAAPGVAEVRLLGQESQAGANALPVRFTLEMRMREPA